MNVKCKVCRKDIEIKEEDYAAGEKITIECERCGNEIEVAIPEREEKSEDRTSKGMVKRTSPEDLAEEESTSVGIDASTEHVAESLGYEEPEETEPVYSFANEEEIPVPPYNPPQSSPSTPIGIPDPEKKGKGWILIVVLLLIACGVGGWWYYDNIYLPEKIDREAPRTYPLVNINLRSSKMAGSDYNKLTSVPFGGELITYNQDGEWAEVKYVKPDGSNATKGYAASGYLVDKKDFYLINSIFGDNDAREILATAKVRRALLNYYKDHGYVGKLSPEMMQEVGLTASTDSQWQAFFPRGEQKPNEVVFKRLVRDDSKYTDMALIIKNINTGERKVLYFYFDDDETPHFLGELPAPSEGTLIDIVNGEGGITPIFSN